MDKVVHFEVPFDDRERAKKFYKDVFGWGFQDMDEMNYTIARTAEVDDNFMIKEAGAINGGMYKRGGMAAKGPVIVLNVENIDEKIKVVETNGGKRVTEKMQVGDMGFYMQVEDSEGNIIGIWQDAKKE